MSGKKGQILNFMIFKLCCGPQSISVADTLGDKLHQENTIFGTSTSFLFYLHHSHHCPLKMGFIITFHHIWNTNLDNSTGGHESIAVVDDWVDALWSLFWQHKLLNTRPVQVPHLKEDNNKVKDKDKYKDTENKDDDEVEESNDNDGSVHWYVSFWHQGYRYLR